MCGFVALPRRLDRLHGVAHINLHGLHKLALARIKLPAFGKGAAQIAFRRAITPGEADADAELIGLEVLPEEVAQ